jgi:P4 family phage/plasmid primase-like protien
MSNSLQFSHGLLNSVTLIQLNHNEVTEYVKRHNDLYEITFSEGKKCRAYIDIDGKMDLTTTEGDFNLTHQMVLSCLADLDIGTPFSLCTSSKYGNKNWNAKNDPITHKLSYSLVFTQKYGSKEAVANWTQQMVAPKIKEVLEMVIPFYIKGVDKDIPETNYLDYDNSVYRINGKMRVVYSTKPQEERPKVIHSEHSVLDTMITYVPADCEALPELAKNEINTPIMKESDNSVLRDVVMSLNKKRADDRKDWLSIGIVLFNENESCDIWDDFSKQSDKYRYGECQRLWRGFRKGNLTQRTFWKMLKEDNPEMFKTLCTRQKSLLDEMDGDINHFSCAKYFVNNRPDDYLYDTTSGWWYIQSNKTWANSVKIPPTLAISVSRLMYSELEQARTIVRQRILENGEDLTKGSYDTTLLKKLLDGTKSVLQAGYIKSIIEFCQGLYAEQTSFRLELSGKSSVKEMMDSNPMIFAFKDSLYDFNKVDGVVVGHRSIEPTDYIVTTCGYNYPQRNHVVRQQIEKVLKGIWGKQGQYGDSGETFEYVMKILSSTLCGTRWMEAFYILTGSGRNGKGLLFELLQAVMGDYYYQLPVQVLTTKIDNPRAPNPDIANLVGKRLACSSEPEANEKLHEGTIKYMTGGDKLTGRALYGAPIQFKPQFGLFLQCNNIPNFNGITRGGVMRNVVIPFPFEFKSKPETSREKKGDAMIKDVLCKSSEWRDEMFYLLLDHFELVRGKSTDAIPMPALVKDRTDEYVSENNLIGVWWAENYIKAEGEYVLSKEAYNDFKAETGSQINDKQFKAGLEFNLLEVKMICKRGAMKSKMGVANWRRKTGEEKEEREPGSDDEKE